MEGRLVVAYLLLALVAVGGLTWAVVARRRRAARKLRMRGVKRKVQRVR